jgi:hypothetical protein
MSVRGVSDPELAEKGFTIIKNVLSAEQVERMKALVTANPSSKDSKASGSNLHRTGAFALLVNEAKVYERVRKLFSEDLFYFGGMEAMHLTKIIPTRFHNDAKGIRISANEKRFTLFDTQRAPHRATEDEVWPVYRLFIYLEDHEKQSGGTKIRAGSHRRAPLFSKIGMRAFFKGKFDKILWPGNGYTNPLVNAGDGVLFNLKCGHSGLYVRPRWPFHRIAFHTKFDNFLKSKLIAKTIGPLMYYPFPKIRRSISIDFCLDSDWARGYQINRILHPSNATGADQYFDPFKKEFLDEMKTAGIEPLPNPIVPPLENFLEHGGQQRP